MNPFFVWLIKSTFSLILLYSLYRLTTRNDKRHQLNRFLLLGVLLISAIIPVLDLPIFYHEIPFEKTEAIREMVVVPIAAEAIVPEPDITFAENTKTEINYWFVFYLSITLLFVIRIVVGWFQISKLISRSEKRRFQRIVLAVVKDLINPFTFINRIVISEKDFNENKDIVVAHEHAHIKQWHALDLMVCELFAVMHFFNPFMWLLRRDLKLIHEYQADEAVLNKGIDAKKYQLLVLEKAVGERRFAMANHFTQKPILKRLNMMQRKKQNRWTWLKLLLFVPLLAVLLQAFARPELISSSEEFIPERYVEDETERWLKNWTLDNIGKGYLSPSIQDINAPRKANNVLVILMNANDEFLIENQHKTKEEVKQIVKNYMHGINPDGKNGPDYQEIIIPELGKLKVSKGIIVYKHDIASSREMVNYTLRAIGEACFEVRNDKAQILFEKDFLALEQKEQKVLEKVVPIWFKYDYPNGPQPSVWLPFEKKPCPEIKPISICFKENGEVVAENHKFNSLDDFFENIAEWSKELEKFNKDRRSKGYYRANVTIEYYMPDEVWRTIQKAFIRNSIQIRGISNYKYKHTTITWTTTKKSSGSGKERLLPKELRDPSVLRVSLFTDEEISLSEIRKNAKECLAKKSSALIEYEKGVSDKEINSVKKLLQKCGYKDINQVAISGNLRKTGFSAVENKSSRESSEVSNNSVLPIPSVRFVEKSLFVNGKSCELKDLEATLEEILPNNPSGRKVRLVEYPNISGKRILQVTSALEKVDNVEIIKEYFTPQTIPPRPPVLALDLYTDKIEYHDRSSGIGRKELKMGEVSDFTEEWIRIKANGIFNKAMIHAHYGVSEERIDELKKEMQKGGAI